MNAPHAILVIDLAYGDCGKGTIVDFLTRRCGAHTVVRFNGGPQAGHNIVTPDGRHHTFAQIGAGTFVPGVKTLLSRFMLIEPYALLNEAKHLRQLGVADSLERVMIDHRCTVITPPHQAANRLLELSRGDKAHGTCGMGIGQTMQDSIDQPHLMISAADLNHRATIIRKLRAIRDLKLEQLRDVIAAVRLHPKAQRDIETLLDISWISPAADKYREVADRSRIISAEVAAKSLSAGGTTVFEGAQGVLLDENYGFHPHTTWSTTTFANADKVLDETQFAGQRTRVGVLRSYFTRHGAGPLVTEDPSLQATLDEPHNDPTGWQGKFRLGVFDLLAARCAIAVSSPMDMLAITHLDRLRSLPQKICTGYQCDGDRHDGLIEENSVVTAIAPDVPETRASSTDRTESLCRCRPIYEPFPFADERAFLDRIQRELRTPIGITSAGPTAGDKRILLNSELNDLSS